MDLWQIRNVRLWIMCMCVCKGPWVRLIKINNTDSAWLRSINCLSSCKMSCNSDWNDHISILLIISSLARFNRVHQRVEVRSHGVTRVTHLLTRYPIPRKRIIINCHFCGYCSAINLGYRLKSKNDSKKKRLNANISNAFTISHTGNFSSVFI